MQSARKSAGVVEPVTGTSSPVDNTAHLVSPATDFPAGSSTSHPTASLSLLLAQTSRTGSLKRTNDRPLGSNRPLLNIWSNTLASCSERTPVAGCVPGMTAGEVAGPANDGVHMKIAQR